MTRIIKKKNHMIYKYFNEIRNTYKNGLYIQFNLAKHNKK